MNPPSVVDALSDSVSNLLIRKNHMDHARAEHRHRTSLGDCISPKDAVALQYFPARNIPSSPAPPSAEHRRTFSASSFPIHPSPKSSKRLTWNIPSSRPRITPTTTALTEQEIQGIEKLGVKFVDPLVTPTPTPSTPPPPTSSQPSTLIRPTIRRNSIINPKRRRSINLQPSPCSNTKNPTDTGYLKPVPTSVDQLLELIVSKSTQVPGKENQSPLLVIDLRSLNSYLGPNGRLKGSINVNFPSLLIKRFLKGTPSNFQLHPFITTEAGKRYYSRLEKTYRSNLTTPSPSPSVLEHLDICVIDDQLGEEQAGNNKPHPAQQSSFGKILLDVLGKWMSYKGRTAGLFYLAGRFEDLVKAPAAQKWLLFGEQQTDATRPDAPHLPDSRSDQATASPNLQPVQLAHSLPPTAPHGLLRLRPSAPTPSLPSIDPGGSSSTTSLPSAAPAPSSSLSNEIVPTSPIYKPKPPKLRRIDTSELLLGTPPRLSGVHRKQTLAQLKTDAQTLSVSPKMASCGVGNPSHLHDHSKSSFRSAIADLSRPHVVGENVGEDFLTHQPSSRPSTGDGGRRSSSPTVLMEMSFKVSTIIPSFLYLGPEPTKESDFEELGKLGIKVILNVALECNKPQEMLDQYKFVDKYYKIPLRDFVEETGIQAGIQKSNQILDHAFLLQSPTYVHCKAGKSRSVTLVLAYLIHRFRWSLKQSYAHVSERRKGVCPNIGFLAELMNFEEREIGSKSRGVTGPVSHKGGRSASHHYSYSTQVPTDVLRRKGSEEEAVRGAGIGFQGYSMDGTSSSDQQQPFDPRRHHGFRVRSMAIGAKTDFFSTPSNPPDSLNACPDHHQTLLRTNNNAHLLKPCRDPGFFRHSANNPFLLLPSGTNPPAAQHPSHNLSPTS